MTGALPTRLELLPVGTGPHRLDGAWWPRSHSLVNELPGLLAALEERWPRITRVTVSRSMWRTGPGLLHLGDHTVHITRSDVAHSPSAICLLSYGVGRCDLLVVAPGASAEEGERLMSAGPAPALTAQVASR
ncbi:DUF5994 family protein [Streptomyces sp. NBC_01537]|uniref:DUF5994 family protein n=1 Tax=Streptomyces sp. NBC_01537 TaxID=2903896 RepID=UPI0038644653